jgi:hypothetical protein
VESRGKTMVMNFPSGHFLVSARNIFETWVFVMAVTAFCFETTTAMWWAKQGAANPRPNSSRATDRQFFTSMTSSFIFRTSD